MLQLNNAEQVLRSTVKHTQYNRMLWLARLRHKFSAFSSSRDNVSAVNTPVNSLRKLVSTTNSSARHRHFIVAQQPQFYISLVIFLVIHYPHLVNFITFLWQYKCAKLHYQGQVKDKHNVWLLHYQGQVKVKSRTNTMLTLTLSRSSQGQVKDKHNVWVLRYQGEVKVKTRTNTMSESYTIKVKSSTNTYSCSLCLTSDSSFIRWSFSL